MGRTPLRWLILVPTVAVIALGFGAFAVFIERVERDNLIADIDDELVRAERTTATAFGNRTGTNRGPTLSDEADSGDQADLFDEVEPPVGLLVGAGGRILAGGGDQNPFKISTLAELATRNGTFTVNDPHYRVRVTPRPNSTVAITALPLDRFDASLRDFRQALIGGGLVILILTTVVVWFLTAAAVRPVTRMAGTATRIAGGALDTRIDAPSGSKETAELAADLDRMLNRLRSTIEDQERSAAEATKARDDMKRFLADVSHELRTPLTALKGYSDLYAGGMLDEPGALDRAMDRIGGESERLYELVNDMLQLARQTAPTEKLELVDVGDILNVVVDDLRAANPDMPIDLEIAPDSDRLVAGHASRVHQAILNVAANACQHTDPTAGVRLQLTSTEASLVIEVIDYGLGIDPAEIDKIFLPFYRPEAARSRDGRGGAGLGLAIASQILERHHGTVTAGETKGGGATFTLMIPLASP